MEVVVGWPEWLRPQNRIRRHNLTILACCCHVPLSVHSRPVLPPNAAPFSPITTEGCRRSPFISDI
jgi:hypothetical protein